MFTHTGTLYSGCFSYSRSCLLSAKSVPSPGRFSCKFILHLLNKTANLIVMQLICLSVHSFNCVACHSELDPHPPSAQIYYDIFHLHVLNKSRRKTTASTRKHSFSVFLMLTQLFIFSSLAYDLQNSICSISCFLPCDSKFSFSSFHKLLSDESYSTYAFFLHTLFCNTLSLSLSLSMSIYLHTRIL